MLLSAARLAGGAPRTLWERSGLQRPSVAIDAAGNVLVADAGSNRVIKFSAAGDSLRAVGGLGWSGDQLDDPSGIATRALDVFVADRNNHRVERFDRDLTLIAGLSTRERPEAAERFGYPRDVALSPEGDLYIVDGENHRVVKFNAFGQFERSFGGVDAAVVLVDPTQVAVDAAGNVYVLDRGRVALFDAFGAPHGTLAGGDSIRAIGADEALLYAVTATDLLALRADAPRTRVCTLPPGSWRSLAVAGSVVALAGEERVRVLHLEETSQR